MGLWGKITGQFIDVIEWVDDSRDTLVWKYPDEDKEIKMGAQLTVRESQVAVFINEGKLADVFQPGRYELVTRNMPIMTTLRSWKHGFDSPFKADVYFVTTRAFTLKWGTQQPIPFPDPDFPSARLRAFGSFVIQISDAAKFFRTCAGTDSHVTTEEILTQLRANVVPKFGAALNQLRTQGHKTLYDVYAKAFEMGDELLPLLAPEFGEYGLTLTKFMVESVTLPEEIQQELERQDAAYREKKRTMSLDNEMELQNRINMANLSQNIGDMDKFMKYQASIGMENSGDGSSNDLAKTMLQMQMMQQMMNNNTGGGAQPAQPTPATNGGGQAPMTREQIMQTLKDLGDLKAAGILSEEEFETKKKELLARL
jgi:membrane protease subunit (stomatin/prohibitin family)